MNSSGVTELPSNRGEARDADLDDDEPAVIQASAMKELPDPRFNEASQASISSEEGVKWKSPKR